jgi:hypothetical protein
MELAEHVEDDPPVIFGWQNMEMFFQVIQVAQAYQEVYQLQLICLIFVQNFKEAVREYARVLIVLIPRVFHARRSNSAKCYVVHMKLGNEIELTLRLLYNGSGFSYSSQESAK